MRSGAALTRRAQANNGKERKDLYSDNWDGDVYKGDAAAPPHARSGAPSAQPAAPRTAADLRPNPIGSGFNVLNLVIVAFVLTPVLGLAFAYWSYGTLWG